ncbi:ABC transporter ATP-binding/permease protein [Maioricimonas rarisocia]|uniref:ABC transporter ATP-binding/permease protein n=1 Tax=Maioricimonas rarisocia TaxID=2528026 RepID=A0A517ZAD9_9PLAN|nr:FHA domain-containing protein [Maioricimonas rarisocia]QDU39455.1 ABC transporter ATP-binding/permease protein [Maioricimonas rarisocia]
MSYLLIVDSGKHKGRKLKISRDNAIVGRDEEAAIRIASQEVSRRHCVLIPTPDGLVVRDLESSNGTFVNGAPILRDTILQSGDVLTVGPMSFRLPGKPAARPAAPESEPDDQNLSDDDIATWLAGAGADAESSEISSSDTTIIPATMTPRLQPIPPKRKKEFKTVADEAADIIRRHYESLEASPNDEAADN